MAPGGTTTPRLALGSRGCSRRDTAVSKCITDTVSKYRDSKAVFLKSCIDSTITACTIMPRRQSYLLVDVLDVFEPALLGWNAQEEPLAYKKRRSWHWTRPRQLTSRQRLQHAPPVPCPQKDSTISAICLMGLQFLRFNSPCKVLLIS